MMVAYIALARHRASVIARMMDLPPSKVHVAGVHSGRLEIRIKERAKASLLVRLQGPLGKVLASCA